MTIYSYIIYEHKNDDRSVLFFLSVFSKTLLLNIINYSVPLNHGVTFMCAFLFFSLYIYLDSLLTFEYFIYV